MKQAEILIREELGIDLTPAQKTWWEWLFDRVRISLNDPYFVEDNPDCETIEFQLEELRWNIEDAAPDYVESEVYWKKRAGEIRSLENLHGKLKEIGYFSPEFHGRMS